MQLELLQYEPPQERNMPKYLHLAILLEQWLTRHNLDKGAKLPSDRRLARHLNFTTVTVNKALQVLAQKGIVTRVVGSGTFLCRGTAPARKLRIGLVCHEPMLEDDSFISILLRELRLQKNAANIDILQATRKPGEYRSTVAEFSLDALIVIGAERCFIPALRELADESFPIVSIGMYWKELPEITFGTDHAAVAEQAVRLLVRNGIREIGIISSRDAEYAALTSSVEERIKGYRKGMWAARLAVNPNWEITYCWRDESELQRQLLQLCRENLLPGAFLLSGIRNVESGFRILTELGIREPKIVTFDHHLRGDLASIPYFSLTQNIHETVERAIRAIDARIHGRFCPRHHPTAPKLESACCNLLQE